MKKLIPLLFLVGCASNQEMSEAYNAQRAIVEAQTQTTPILQVQCGNQEDACKGFTMVYNPRRDIVVPSVTNTNDVLKESIAPITDMLTTGSVVFGLARTAKTFSENGGQGNTNVRNTHILNESNDNAINSENSLGTQEPFVVKPEIIENKHTDVTKEVIRE